MLMQWQSSPKLTERLVGIVNMVKFAYYMSYGGCSDFRDWDKPFYLWYSGIAEGQTAWDRHTGIIRSYLVRFWPIPGKPTSASGSKPVSSGMYLDCANSESLRVMDTTLFILENTVPCNCIVYCITPRLMRCTWTNGLSLPSPGARLYEWVSFQMISTPAICIHLRDPGPKPAQPTNLKFLTHRNYER